MKNRITWTADEFKPHDHGLSWYVGLFLIGGLLVAWGLYANNVIATILFLLIIVVLYGLSNKHPESVHVEISDEGVRVNEKLYAYKNIKRFWIIEPENSEAELNVEIKNRFNRHITILMGSEDPGEVRGFLREFLEELEDYNENFIDSLIRMLRL